MNTTRTQEPSGPPYQRYAFLNPYTLSVLVGALSVSLVTERYGIALCAVAAQAAWILLAPESSVLRRLWFDRKWASECKARDEATMSERISKLVPFDRPRVNALLAWKERVGALVVENPSLAGELVRGELAKLDGLVEGFIDLGLTVARCEEHVGSFDFRRMRVSDDAYKKALDSLAADDPRRDVALRNIAIFEKRRARFDDLLRTSQIARGRMDLIENTVRLLADEIVTMGRAADLGGRLDELRFAVEAIRETTGDDGVAFEERLGRAG